MTRLGASMYVDIIVGLDGSRGQRSRSPGSKVKSHRGQRSNNCFSLLLGLILPKLGGSIYVDIRIGLDGSKGQRSKSLGSKVK